MANSCVIESEGWQEVKQIEALNASRPDSMDAMFYHKYWSIIVFYHKYWSIIDGCNIFCRLLEGRLEILNKF